MPLRDFKDDMGGQWSVWETYPMRGDSSGRETALGRFMASQPDHQGTKPGTVRQQYKLGWLTFASHGEKRRLAPVPEHWAEQPDDVLRLWLRSAQVIPKPAK